MTVRNPGWAAAVSSGGGAPAALPWIAGTARACAFLTIASGAIVVTEPAPYDLLMLGLFVPLALAGLLAVTPALLLQLALWLVCACGAFLASALSLDVARSTAHGTVSLYLYLSSFVFAAFVASNPVAHTRLVLRAYLLAALLAATAGIVGYFGAFDLFTKYGRASGTFKDPNVFAAFLVPAILYVAHTALARPWSRLIAPALAALVLALALLVSFSRGAWTNLAVGLCAYAYLRFVTSASHRLRLRVVVLLAGLVIVAGIVVAAALQADATAALFAERSRLAQSYDLGPDGRFAGQLEAWTVLLDNPLGIGGLQFAPTYHNEDVHNVYLSMFLNAGWMGGCAYLAVVALTLVLGVLNALRANPARPELVLAYSAFVGLVVEGAIIDTDHWRHFYLLVAIIWGLWGAAGAPRPASRQ